MSRRGTPIFQMQTAVFAVLTLCSIAFFLSTVKLATRDLYVSLTVVPKTLAVESAPQDSMTYVIVMFAALAIIFIASTSLGLNLAGLTSRIPARLAAVVALGWSWILLLGIAAPAVLPCGRGVAIDPWRVIHHPLDPHGVYLSFPRDGYEYSSGLYVNLCSLNTQQSAHAAVGFAGLALVATLVPALTAFLIARVARLAWTPAAA